MSPVAYTILLLTAIGVYSVLTRIGRPPLPPGPKGKILSGNVHQLPRSEPWKTFAEWSNQFRSPIVTFRLFGRRTIILNTWKTASDLLDSRSKTYSDRPVAWMYHELVGRKLAVFNISSQNPRFPVYRRMLHSSLNPRVIQDYDGLLDEESRTLLKSLKASPDKFAKHLRRNAGAVILRVAYGWTVTEDDDYFVNLMEHVFRLGVEVTKPGRWLVDMFPIVRYLPNWFPGASFHRHAAAYRAEFAKSDTIPHAWAKEQIQKGDHYYESFTSQHIKPVDGHKVTSEEDDIIKWCSAALYAGGADTTVAALLSFVLLMILYPEVQARAQTQIDQIIGKDRLPTPADEDSLPYISAIIKEVLRFAPVAPLGLPHRVVHDDCYEGLRIPSSVTILANIWAIGRDPQLHAEPGRFNPERFLGKGAEQDPRKYVFGFGRRICPGLHFAERALFLNISRILALYTIRRAVDEEGREISIESVWVGGVTTHPKPFQCQFVPRRAFPDDLT